MARIYIGPHGEQIPEPSRPRLEVYKAKNGQWSWRKRGRNGRIASVSGETFARPGYAKKAARREYPDLPVLDLTWVNVSGAKAPQE